MSFDELEDGVGARFYAPGERPLLTPKSKKHYPLDGFELVLYATAMELHARGLDRLLGARGATFYPDNSDDLVMARIRRLIEVGGKLKGDYVKYIYDPNGRNPEVLDRKIRYLRRNGNLASDTPYIGDAVGLCILRSHFNQREWGKVPKEDQALLAIAAKDIAEIFLAQRGS